MTDPWKTRIERNMAVIAAAEQEAWHLRRRIEALQRERTGIYNEWEAHKEGLRRERAAAFEREMKDA